MSDQDAYQTQLRQLQQRCYLYQTILDNIPYHAYFKNTGSEFIITNQDMHHRCL